MRALGCVAGTVVAVTLLAATPMRAATYTYAQLYTFTGGADGYAPFAGLTYQGGLLYGTTAFGGNGGGVVYAVNPVTGAETVIHTFTGTDGAQPYAGVIYYDGNLYGTAVYGGTADLGVVYKIKAKTNEYKVIHHFEKNADGAEPYGGVIYENGMLYGTTQQGGAHGLGTVFAIDLATRAETVLHSFAEDGDGQSPNAGVIYQDGFLYGTTNNANGAVYALDIATGTETILHQFAGTPDGLNPSALIYQGGKLYGTTYRGGTANDGTIFSIDPVSGAETICHDFVRKEEGQFPQGSLIVHGDEFYGTTAFGGHTNGGTAFRFNAATGAYEALYRFTDAKTPIAPLLFHAGSFYGTLVNNIYGAVFRLAP